MNLIVTCSRNFELETEQEIKKILIELGDEKPDITITEISGILSIITKINPELIIEKIKEKIIDEPWTIRYCLRIIPVHITVNTEINEITQASLQLIKIIKKNESYRITIEKRNNSILKKEIISSIAKKIQNKVSLENYDWVLLIEILGKKTGISFLKNYSILSVQKTKRSILN